MANDEFCDTADNAVRDDDVTEPAAGRMMGLRPIMTGRRAQVLSGIAVGAAVTLLALAPGTITGTSQSEVVLGMF